MNKQLLWIGIITVVYGCKSKFSDQGQYSLPAITTAPEYYWTCTGILGEQSHNSLTEDRLAKGLPYHLLAQSLQGLSFLAVAEGKSKTAVWMDDPAGRRSYAVSKAALEEMGIREIGRSDAVALAAIQHDATAPAAGWTGRDGSPSYVLTDLRNNPESGNVATVAAHVYQAIIVDVRDSAYYNAHGYAMQYDASKKTVADAWHEFKDRCSNDALVLMPVNTGELRSYAIAHRLFVLNLNKVQGQPEYGQNGALFGEILAWLNPGAPVLGWEQGVGEDVFVKEATRYGHPLVPYDWGYNTDFTALRYKHRQKGTVKADNPKNYVYDSAKRYVSFYLSDGDNIQWMMNSFESPHYYSNPDIRETKMSFGLPIFSLSMIAPAQLDNLIARQDAASTLMENFGGGYYYADEFGSQSDRKERLTEIARHTAAHMRQRNCKVLGLFALDCRSDAAKEAYQAYITANDQLEGIVVVQYDPYAGGNGEIFWFPNAEGYDIPVVTVRYSIWNFKENQSNQGTPAYIASQLNSLPTPAFSVVCVHAWSGFADIGDSDDPIAETSGRSIVGASAAKQCMKRLAGGHAVVNTQELIWQVRMHYRREQTTAYLSRDMVE